MKAKLTIAIFLHIICLTFSGCSDAGDKQLMATTEYIKSDLSIFTEFSKVSYDDGEFYIVKGSSIYALDANFEQAGKIVTEVSNISAICASDKKIYLSGYADSNIYVYSSNGDLIDKYDIAPDLGNANISGILCVNNKIALKVVYFQGDMGNENLFIYDLKRGTMDKYFIDSFADMTVYKNDSILIMSHNIYTGEKNIYETSVKNGQKKEILKTNENMTNGFCYDDYTESIFFSDGSNVKRVKINNGRIQEVFKSNHQIIRNVFTDKSKCYVFDEKAMSVYTIGKNLQTKFVYGVLAEKGIDQKEIKGLKLYSINTDYAVEPKADDDGNFYFMAQNEIIVSDKKFNIIKIIKDINGRLHLDLNGHKIYYYDNLENSIVATNLDGIQQKIYHLESNVESSGKMIAMDNYLIMVAAMTNKRGVLILDINKEELLFRDVERPGEIYRYKGDLVLKPVRNNENDFVSIEYYDLIKDIAVDSVCVDINSGASNFTYHEDTNTIYYTIKGNVYRLNMNDGSDKPVFKSDIGELSSIIINDGYCYLFNRQYNKVYEIEMNSYVEYYENTVYAEKISDINGVLNVLLINSSNQIKEFNKKLDDVMTVKYPNIEIRYEFAENTPQGKEDYKNKILMELMSNGSSFDIFEYNPSVLPPNVLASDGVMGIENSGKIISYLNSLFKGVTNIVSSNYKIRGIPVTVGGGFSTTAWQVNTELFEKTGIKKPDFGWTYEDFYGLSKEFKQDFDGDGIIDTYIISIAADNIYDPAGLLIRFCNNILNGRTENLTKMQLKNDLADLSNTLYKMKNEKLFQISTKKTDNVAFWTGLPLHPFLTVEQFISPPSLKSLNTNLVGKVEMLCANRYSENVDVVLEYLETYVSDDVQFAVKNYINPLYCNKVKYIENNRTSSGGYSIMSDERFNDYSQVMNNIDIRIFSMDLTLYQREVEGKYFNGEIGINEFTDLILNKIWMVKEE